MKYRNKITGAVVDFKGKVAGAWEPVEVPKAPVKETVEEVKEAPAQKKKGTKK